MTKYVFRKPNKDDIIYLNDDGELVTDCSSAAIQYVIDREDNDVNLTIESCFFRASDLDEFIEFLKAVREEIA